MGNVSIGILIYIAVLAVSVVLLVALMLVQKQKKSKEEEGFTRRKIKSQSKNYLIWVYHFYRAMPFLNRYFAKVKAKVILMYPADSYSVNIMTSRILAKGSIGGIACVALVLFISDGNIFFICSGLLLSYVVITEIVTNSVNNLETKIKEQFQLALQKVRHHYHSCKDVTAAIAISLDELPYEIGLHMQTIYDILVSPNMKYESDKYVDACPDKRILTFLATCTSIKEMGDKQLENGQSLFLTNLEQISADIADEVLMSKINKIAFSSLSWIAILPIVLVKPVENWVTGNIPEVKSYYEGIYGTVSMVAIFILSFLAHSLVISLRDKDREIEKENDIFAKMAEMPVLSSFLSKVIKKQFTKYNSYNNDLKGMGDRTGPKAFLLKRFTFAIAAFGLTVGILFFSGITEKISLLNNFEEDFVNAVVPNEEYRIQMRELAADYANFSAQYDFTEEELTKKIMSEQSVKQSYAQLIAQAVLKHVSEHDNTYFKWFYLLIALGLGFAGFMVPVAMLKFRKSVIEMRKQEEVMQFQSLMLILMHMDGIALAEILEWLERFSYCFKEEIAACRVNLNSGHKTSLNDMKALVGYEPFINFIDNLIAIEDVGVEDAFDEVRQEREYSRKNREIEMRESIKKKAGKAKVASYTPPIAVMVLYLIVPMVLFAIKMFEQFQTIM